ncbi:hypothetical protein [Senegalia sp. (in: firmicutes)]|uniref:hypothetical protein n=1 Tax=Senegalia sp. (in: firmicutes) TaxID=1924098 RepID=UPI003F9D36B8
MARKKVVLFIVEGITDQESLELLLEEFIPNDNQIIFEVVDGDITSSNNVDKKNIKSKITDIIKGGGKRKFKPSDYLEVIHLVDMDAVFISEENIYEDQSANKLIYKEDGIYAKNIESVIKRNNKKKGLLNLLLSTNKVYKSVPYRVFYFSCNLEHVLHDKIEVEEKLKIKYARDFQDKYIDDLDGFVNLICNSIFTVDKEYKDSWDFIKKDNNSIKRFTNFNILLKDYLNE